MMKKHPVNAYESAKLMTLKGRALESHALQRAAVLLDTCRGHWGDAGHDKRLREALTFTQRLWTIFQVELTSNKNVMPPEIVHNLLNLSQFIDQSIFDIQANPAPEKLDILISINREIAAGLEAAPAEASPSP